MNKVQEKSRITACKRILRNAKRHFRHFGSNSKFLEYANTIDGMQYVCDGYRIAAFKNPLPLEERPDNIELNCDLKAHLQGNTDNSTILKIPDKKALKAYIKAYKEKLETMGIKHPLTPPPYNFGRGLPKVNSQYLLDMINIFPDGTFYANGKYDILIRDHEGNIGKLLGLRKRDEDEDAEATQL